jgi:hypothetical protein
MLLLWLTQLQEIQLINALITLILQFYIILYLKT